MGYIGNANPGNKDKVKKRNYVSNKTPTKSKKNVNTLRNAFSEWQIGYVNRPNNKK